MKGTRRQGAMNVSQKNLLIFLLSIAVPGLIAVFRPFGMDLRQALTTTALAITIIWWSTGVVKKIPACLFLLLSFTLLQSAPLKTIFTFPLGENFYLIIITYLFSQAVSNSGLIDVFLLPLLKKYATTPLRVVFCMLLVFFASIYIIPQPIARLILIASVFMEFFKKTNVTTETRHALMFICFSLFALVNMSMRDSDLILNTSTVGFAGLSFSNFDWIKYMFVPTMFYLAVAAALHIFIYRGYILNVTFAIEDSREKQGLSPRQRNAGIVILLTVVLWISSSFFYISLTLITLMAVIILAAMGFLHKSDLKAIDVTTMVFLTAAFSIGGVLKSCGAADILFTQMRKLFPSEPSLLYLFILVTVGIAVHMVLGSNTTTLSVIVPGFIALAGEFYPTEIVMLIAFICVAYHALMPFHCVTIAIGAGNHYFPAEYIFRYGVPALVLIYIAVFLFYIPWWSIMGLI